VDKLHRAISESSEKAHVQKRRVDLWDLHGIQGLTFDECAKRLKVTKRQLFYDWEVMRPLMIDALADEIETMRTRCVARAEHLYSIALAELTKMAKRRGVAPTAIAKLVYTALKANWDLAQLIPGVVSHHHEITGRAGGPIEVVALEELTDEELDDKLAEIRRKTDTLIEMSRTPPPGIGGNGDDSDDDEEVGRSDAGGNGKG
jgi:hypothetical protein